MPLFGKGKSSDPVTLLKSGDFKGAIKLLEKKLQQNPNDFTTRLRLAEAYEGAGRKDDAAVIYREEGESNLAGGTRAPGIALLRKAAKLKPDDAALAARLASLEGGGGQSGSAGSFSFDMDVAEESAAEASAESVPAEPSEHEVPPPSPGEEKAAEATGTLEIVEPPSESPPPEPADSAVPAQSPDAPAAVEAIPVEVPSEKPAEIPAAPLEKGPPAAEIVGEPAPESPEKKAEPTFEAVPPEVGPEAQAEVEPLPPPEEETVEELPLEALDAAEAAIEEPEAEASSVPTPEIVTPELVEVSEEITDRPSGGILPEAPVVAGTQAGPFAPPLSRLLRPDDPAALMQELFPGISAKEAAELGATLKPRELSPGQTLIREGEEGDSLFLVMEGSLEASGRFEGAALRLALLGRCDVIGEVAFLKDVPRTATVLALEPSVVLELSRTVVTERFQDRPELLGRLEGILEERVANTIRALKDRWKDS